jgi:hypothetical protein
MAMANLRGGHNLERAEFNGAVEMHLASTLAPPPPSAGNGTPRDFSQNSYDHLYVLITIPINIRLKEAKMTDSTQERSKDATTQDQLNTRRPALTSPMHIARRACILVAQGLEMMRCSPALTSPVFAARRACTLVAPNGMR